MAMKAGEIGDVAVHAVMPFDNEQRMPMARAQLGEHLVGRFVVEMGERHAPRARQDRALHDAVVDQRIVDDHIVAPKQMADHRDVGRMAADQGDAVFGAVDSRQRLFELAMDRALAGDRAAGRDRGAIAIDRRLCRRRDARVAVEADVIVRGEIDVVLPSITVSAPAMP